MKDILNEYVKKFQTKHKNLKRYIALFSILAVFTVIGVNWGLHQKGISLTDDAQAVDMSKQVTKLSGEGTVYDEEGNMYSSKLRMDFSFPAGTVTEDQLDFYYEYPEGIVIPSGLLDGTQHDLLDDTGTKAGVYYFEKTEDGKYRVRVKFDEKYADQDKAISGYVQFEGQVDGSKGDDDGNIKIIGKDNVTLDIPKEEITYPDNATNHYDLTTSKTGNYSVKDGKLVYTVYVTSIKGTPDDIHLEDTINADGLKLGTPEVKVTEETIIRYYEEDGIHYSDDFTNLTSKEINVDSSYKNGKLEVTLPKIDPAKEGEKNKDGLTPKTYKRYKVEYTYDVSDIEKDSVDVNNTVSASSKNNKTEVKSKSDAKVTVENKHTVSKAGKFDSAKDQIQWTITVNSNQIDIAGSKLTDDMLAKLAEGTNVTIEPDEGYEITRDKDGKITGIEFKKLSNGKNNNKYTIKYNTPAQSQWGDTTVSNTAKFEPGDNSGKIDSTAKVTVSGGAIEKEYETASPSVDGKTVDVTWNSTITVPEGGIPKGTKITDDPTQDRWGVSGGKQYLTYDQVCNWPNEIYWTDANGAKVGDNLALTEGNLATITFKASDGNTYTYQDIKQDKDNKFSDMTYTVCTIELNSDLTVPEGAKKLVFHYTTTADVSEVGIGSTYYKNTFAVGDKKVDALYGYNKGGVIKTDENNVEDTTQKVNADGTLTWKIKVSITEDTNSLTFTDMLPEGVTLVGVKGEDGLAELNDIKIDDKTIYGYGNYYRVNGSYGYDGQKLELVVGPKDGVNVAFQPKVYTFVITCKVDKDKIADYESGKTYVFKNTASVSNDKGMIGAADQTQEWTEDTKQEESKVIEKTGAWDNNTRRVKYSIKLNPDEKDIVEGSDVLTLKDKFTYYNLIHGLPEGVYQGTGTKYNLNAWLVPDSVKLYKAVKKADGTLEKGEEITDWTWTVKTSEEGYLDGLGGKHEYSTLTGTNLPDSTAMILEYEYQLQTDMPEGYRSVDKLGISNDAELDGTSYKDGKEQDDVKWNKQTSTGEVTSEIQGILYKVSKGDYGKALPGAQFKLQKFNGSEYVDTDVTYTTDSKGKLTVKWSDGKYEHNTLYRVVETSAPEGYMLPDNPEKNAFYFYFSSDTDTANKLPDKIPESAQDLSKESKIVYVENEKGTTGVTINKRWLKKNGDLDTGHTGSIQVELYQKASTTSSATEEDATVSGDIKLADIGNQNVWKTIETQSYASGTKVSFTITSTVSWYSTQPVIYVNGKEITPTTSQWDGQKLVWTYSFEVESGENIITGALLGWWNDPEESIQLSEIKSETSDSNADKGEDSITEKLYGTYDITSESDWSKTISNLPLKGKNDAGKTVYYTYYVKEVGNENYDTTYDNNEGITSGTITINNTTSENPSYELPKTGGIGTTWLTVGGISLMIAASLCGYSMKRRRRRNIR